MRRATLPRVKRDKHCWDGEKLSPGLFLFNKVTLGLFQRRSRLHSRPTSNVPVGLSVKISVVREKTWQSFPIARGSAFSFCFHSVSIIPLSAFVYFLCSVSYLSPGVVIIIIASCPSTCLACLARSLMSSQAFPLFSCSFFCEDNLRRVFPGGGCSLAHSYEDPFSCKANEVEIK